MGGRSWLALLVVIPLGLLAAAEAAPSADVGATATAAAEEPTAVTVVSGDPVSLRTTSGLMDTVTGAATPAVGTLLVAGKCPGDGELTVRAVSGESAVELTARTEDVASTCLVTLDWNGVALTAPAAGHLVVAEAGLDDAAVAYAITRTTGFSAFLAILLLSLAYGVIGARLIRGRVKELEVPSNWSFKDGWASSLTGLTAVAAGLLTLGGVLTEYAPQYSTAGVLAANLVVLVLVGVAPLVFTALGGTSSEPADRRRGLVAAGALSLTAAAGQLSLVALVVVSGSTIGLARVATGALLVVALGVILLYTSHQAETVVTRAGSASI
jgi:hypothetical protein